MRGAHLTARAPPLLSRCAAWRVRMREAWERSLQLRTRQWSWRLLRTAAVQTAAQVMGSSLTPLLGTAGGPRRAAAARLVQRAAGSAPPLQTARRPLGRRGRPPGRPAPAAAVAALRRGRPCTAPLPRRPRRRRPRQRTPYTRAAMRCASAATSWAQWPPTRPRWSCSRSTSRRCSTGRSRTTRRAPGPAARQRCHSAPQRTLPPDLQHAGGVRLRRSALQLRARRAAGPVGKGGGGLHARAGGGAAQQLCAVQPRARPRRCLPNSRACVGVRIPCCLASRGMQRRRRGTRGWVPRIARDRLGSYSAAVQDFSAAIMLDPRNADFYHNRGFSQRKQARAAAARRLPNWHCWLAASHTQMLAASLPHTTGLTCLSSWHARQPPMPQRAGGRAASRPPCRTTARPSSTTGGTAEHTTTARSRTTGWAASTWPCARCLAAGPASRCACWPRHLVQLVPCGRR